jgi:nucleotide-binding universal stress UspA family protein
MGKILCAVRGGEGSYGTLDGAFALAKERGDDLVFLYVADVSFLNQTAAPLVVDVDLRLERMGRFQLTMAQERAAAQGVAAEIVVRKGQLRTAVFDETALQLFAAILESETGADVRII